MKNPDGSTPKFEYKFKCTGRGGCKKTYVAEAADVDVAYFGRNYGGDRPSREYYVPCVCGKDNIIDKPLPAEVRAMADAKEKARNENK